MKNNIKGFSLILAMGIVLIITILSLSILEYIIPFSRNIKGIENSSVAYYNANSGIEEGLYYLSTRSGSAERNEKSDSDFSGNINTIYNTTSSGGFLPPTGEGNSEYNLDWNQIAAGNPIQLSVGYNNINTDWSNVKIDFRVPDLNEDLSWSETLSGGTILPIINWQLSAGNNTINAYSGDLIFAEEINLISGILLESLQGIDLGGDKTINSEFRTFYENNCNSSDRCTLKFSIVNKLETGDSVSIPYLEWQLNFGSNTLPLRYTNIESSGKSYGYKKDLDIKVATQTVNEAFDFTVFQ